MNNEAKGIRHRRGCFPPPITSVVQSSVLANPFAGRFFLSSLLLSPFGEVVSLGRGGGIRAAVGLGALRRAIVIPLFFYNGMAKLLPLFEVASKKKLKTITSLCADLAQLEGRNFLQGDHNLKVLRQECYISQQKRFINYLVNQLATHKFLKIACQLERQTKISSAYSLLRAIEMEMQSYLLAVDGRLDRYHLISQAASEMLEEGSVDDRDAFLHAVRDMLRSHSSTQPMTPTYVSSYGLVQQLSELQDELCYHQHVLENVFPRERGRHIDELCRISQTLEQILPVPLTYGQLKMTSWPMVSALEELESINQQISASVSEVTMARDEKAEILQQPSRNAQQERRAFVDFFCHPERLENQVRELTSRVKALPE